MSASSLFDNRRAVCATTACFPGQSYVAALALIQRGVSGPMIGALSIDHCQLCPQSSGILTEDIIDALRHAAPATKLRLHANVRVTAAHVVYDASTVNARTLPYFRRLAELSRYMGARVYSLHAGRRANATLEEVRAGVDCLTELFDHTVAVEGLYPTTRDGWLLADWAEYQWLLDSRMPFALDLSHLAIVAAKTRRQERALMLELLTSEHCVEIHLSDNDGRADAHRPLLHLPWWWEVFTAARPHLSPQTVVFSEGTQHTHGSPPRLQ